MSGLNKNKALSQDERKVIEQGIYSGSSKAAIASALGRDKSTIGKEIRLHRILRYKCRLGRECAAYKHCKRGRECTDDCPDFVCFTCSRRDRSPGACNGCADYDRCRFSKYYYSATAAEAEYRDTLVNSRSGVNLTEEEAKRMAAIIGPALRNGHSPYRILQDHPELNISEKTLYNYIDQKAFGVVGISNIELRRKVSRRVPKKLTHNYKKRNARAYLKGRKYEDYLAYRETCPNASIVQMDTVYNSITDGPFMQTFKFISYDLMIAVYHDTKTAQDMLDGVNLMNRILGDALFKELFEILLTDRGDEFTYAEAMETGADGKHRCHVFYCDPMQSGQKGSLEQNHEELRYICPHKVDLRSIGLVSQEALNFAISSIASSSHPAIQGKSPIEYVRFMKPELWDRLQTFGIQEIPRDDINLTKNCLKAFIRNPGKGKQE